MCSCGQAAVEVENLHFDSEVGCGVAGDTAPVSSEGLLVEAGYALGQARRILAPPRLMVRGRRRRCCSQGRRTVERAVREAGQHWLGDGAGTYREVGHGQIA